jgi:hypothetical protein
MPYYIGAGTPEWDEYMEMAEAGSDEPPASMFTSIEPWQAETTVLPFPTTPGPEPELPQRPAYSAGNWLENYKKAEKATSVHALWKVCGLAATCRALGVKRVFGSYNGGGDESFTHYHGVEMSDGHVIPASSALRTGCAESHAASTTLNWWKTPFRLSWAPMMRVNSLCTAWSLSTSTPA